MVRLYALQIYSSKLRLSRVNSPYNTKNTLVANVINRNNNNLIKGVKC